MHKTNKGISNYHEAQTITKQIMLQIAKYHKPKNDQHYLSMLHSRRTLKLIASDNKTILTLLAFSIFTLFLNTMNFKFT